MAGMLQANDAAQHAREAAARRGERALLPVEIAGSELARDDLPVNTLDAPERTGEGKNVGLAELAMSLASDALTMLVLGEA